MVIKRQRKTKTKKTAKRKMTLMMREKTKRARRSNLAAQTKKKQIDSSDAQWGDCTERMQHRTPCRHFHKAVGRLMHVVAD